MITLRDGGIADVRRVRPTPARRSWIARAWRRLVAAPEQFVIGEAQDVTVPVDAGQIAGRERFCLIDARSDRPRLNLLPGMRGEVVVGACSVSAEQMLRDPALRRPEGESSYPLPNGAQARIRCGRITFLIRLIAPEAPLTSAAG